VVLLAVFGCKDSAWTPMGSADVVLSDLKLRGTAGVSKRLDTDESFARSVMSGIATGDSTWLVVAATIKPPSAAAEASLATALASALTQSPAQVLAITGDRYPLGEVCGIPFRRPDSSMVLTYHAEAIAALTRVRDSSLTRKRDACRGVLDDARDEKLRRVDPSYLLKNKPGTTTPVRK
jgi:hypothetical protein